MMQMQSCPWRSTYLVLYHPPYIVRVSALCVIYGYFIRIPSRKSWGELHSFLDVATPLLKYMWVYKQSLCVSPSVRISPSSPITDLRFGLSTVTGCLPTSLVQHKVETLCPWYFLSYSIIINDLKYRCKVTSEKNIQLCSTPCCGA
jgi:hypothetical protein